MSRQEINVRGRFRSHERAKLNKIEVRYVLSAYDHSTRNETLDGAYALPNSQELSGK